jgi:hypothetical protein
MSINSLLNVGKKNHNASQVQPSNPCGQFLSNLQTLKQTDPAKLQATLTDIADHLSAAAQNTTGQQAQNLSVLSQKFRAAAQTGDLSILRQPGTNLQPALNLHNLGTAQNKKSGHSLFGNIFKTVSHS